MKHENYIVQRYNPRRRKWENECYFGCLEDAINIAKTLLNGRVVARVIEKHTKRVVFEKGEKKVGFKLPKRIAELTGKETI